MCIRDSYEGGEALITAREIPRAYWIAPAVYVDSYNAGTLTITIDQTGPEADLFKALSQPGLFWAATWGLRLYELATVWAGGYAATVASVTSTTITLAAAPPFDPQAGDLICLEDSTPGDTGNLNALDADVEDYAFGADSALEVGGGTRPGPPWG